MKELFNSLAISFCVYSKIPMPQVNWEKSNMKYVLCFFPIIGAIIGGFLVLWYWLAITFNFNALLFSGVAVLIPILITGGIHLDGYLDSCDAICSYGDTEKKLVIMKDPRAGAFAVIYCIVYIVLCMALFSQLYQNRCENMVLFVALGYVLSRCICGIFTVSVNCAKSSGLAHMFSDTADKVPVKVVLSVLMAVCILSMAFLSIWNAVIVSLFICGFVVWFSRYCKKQFGGITGDLAGFTLQITECAVLAIAIFVI